MPVDTVYNATSCPWPFFTLHLVHTSCSAFIALCNVLFYYMVYHLRLSPVFCYIVNYVVVNVLTRTLLIWDVLLHFACR